MILRKSSITVDTTSNNSSTGGYFYSTESQFGYVDAVQLTRGTIPSTATLLVTGETTGHAYIQFTCSTETYKMFYPRTFQHSSSGGVIGAATDYPMAKFPVYGELFRVSLAGGTSSQTSGLVEVWISGG